jgi:hypothetical protein
MINLNKKRMVFAFYINEHTFENPLNNVHLYFLQKNINLFDEVIVGIIKDDDLDESYVRDLKQRFLSMYHKNISFKTYPNTQYRETLVFYNEIATKLSSLDGETFFAHNKHTSDMPLEEILEWICGLYFFNLEYTEYQTTGMCFWGNPKITESSLNLKSVVNKHKWYYAGCFYWIYGQEVYRFMERHGVLLPPLTDRYYGEMLPGEIYTHGGFGNSLGDCYLIMEGTSVHETYQLIFSKSMPFEYGKFMSLYNKILSMLKNEVFG